MSLLIFGGTGFIGSSLIQSQKKIEKIVSFSSKNIGIFEKNKKIKISKKVAIKKLKNFKKIDAIFCASTRYNPKKYSEKPKKVFKNNINSVLRFIRLLDNFEINKIILISSYAVYGHRSKRYNVENSIISVKNFSHKEFYYASAKYLQEELIMNFCKKKKLKMIILRLPSVYGPGSTLKKENAHVIPSFIMQNLKKLKKMTIFGNGKEKREFLYIMDLIQIILKFRKINDIGIFNIGPNKFISIKYLLNFIIKSTNSNIKTKFNNVSFSDVPLRKVSYKKFNKIFKKYKYTKFESGLKNTINWYRKNLND